MDNRLNVQCRSISQEGLKLLACLTMLLDHTGAILVAEILRSGAEYGFLRQLYTLLRTIGRISFPIYCYLLTEGVHYTKNPRRYFLRLLIAALLAELPYDLALRGGFTGFLRKSGGSRCF